MVCFTASFNFHIFLSYILVGICGCCVQFNYLYWWQQALTFQRKVIMFFSAVYHNIIMQMFHTSWNAISYVLEESFFFVVVSRLNICPSLWDTLAFMGLIKTSKILLCWMLIINVGTVLLLDARHRLMPSV